MECLIESCTLAVLQKPYRFPKKKEILPRTSVNRVHNPDNPTEFSPEWKGAVAMSPYKKNETPSVFSSLRFETVEVFL